MLQLFDTLTTDGNARICADGSLVAEVRCARTGIQEYLGSEVDPTGALGLRDKAMVRVYRPAEEVFSRDSLATFAAAPVTIDHPTVAVTADNWRRLGVGEINGDVVRDGEFVRVPIIVRDAPAVAKVRTTHKQLSMGYACRLDPTPGLTADGQPYDAVQRDIRINHIAAVPAARGGPELKISDHSQPRKEPRMKIVMLDGIPVNLGDEAAVEAAFKKLQDNATAAATATADAKAALATETGKVAALEAKLADAEAKVQPAALDKLVADRSALIATAKAIAPAVVTEGMADAEIRRAVVTAKLGDKCPADDAAVAGAFAVLAVSPTADAKPAVVNLTPAQFVAGAGVVSALRSARYS